VTEEEDSGPEEEEEKGCRDWAVKNRAHTHTHTYLFLLFGIRSKICGSMSISSLNENTPSYQVHWSGRISPGPLLILCPE
jgi:hypothetical protein